MTDKTQELGTKFTADTKNVSENVKRYLKLLEVLEKANRRVVAASSTGMKEAAGSINQVSQRLEKGAQGVKKYASEWNKATKAVKKHDDSQVALGKRIGHISRFADQVRSAFRVTAAYGIAATVIFGMVNSVRAGTKEIVDFDQALHNLEAITGATSSQIAAMSDVIKKVAHDTKYSTTEVAEGMVLLGQAGFSAEEAIQAIGAVSELATGTLSNMQLTTDLLTTTIRAFNLNAIESNRVADVMASAINKSKLTIDKLRIAFNYVGSAAHQTGLSLEETAASMMVLANNGLRASTIGTGLRQMLARLLAPNRLLRRAFEEHGIALDKVNPRLVGYQTAIKNLIPVLYDYKKGTINMSKAYELFGLRGAQAAAVISQAFIGGQFRKMLDNVYEVGTAAAMAEIQAEGLGVMWKNLIDRAKLLAIAVGELGVAGAIRGMIDFMRQAVDLTVELIKSFGDLTGHSKLLEIELGRQVVEHQKVVSSLTAYKGAFDSLIKKMKEGIDVSERHATLVKRFTKDHPELAAKIDLTTKSYKELSESLKVFDKVIDQNAISAIFKQADLLKRLNADLVNITPIASDKELKRAKLNIRKIREELEDMIFAISQRQSYQPVQYSGLINSLGLGDDDVKKIKSNVNKMFDELQKATADFDPSKFQKELQKWPEAFEELYNSLDPDKRGDFLKAFKTFKARLADIKKTAQQAGKDLTDEDLKVEEDKFLTEFKERLNKEKTELIKLERDYYAMKAKFSIEAHEKIENERQAELERIMKYQENRLAYIRKYGGDEQDAKNKVHELELEANKFYDQKKIDLDLKLSNKRAAIDKTLSAIKAEEMKSESTNSLRSKEETKRIEEKLDIEYLSKAVQHQKEHLEKTKGIWGEGTRQTLDAEAKYLDSVLALKKAETNADIREANRRVQIKIKELKDKLKYIKKYSNEYFEIIKKIRELEATPVSEDEDIEVRLRNSNRWLDGIRLALRKHEKEHKTYTERIAEAWSDSFDSMGNSFNSFLDDAIEGRLKSASEYIRDFLLDVAHAINRQLAQVAASGLMNLAGSGLASLFGGGASYAGAGTYGVNPGSVNWHDKGGWIREPVIGKGLHTGELYGIAENRPEYVSPDGKPGGNITLQTEINVSVEGSGRGSDDAKELGNAISATIKSEFTSFLVDELRPGGLLNQGV